METLLPHDKDAFIQALETIKVLEQNDFETYSIVKHGETQQHYLRYFLVHINLVEGGRRNEHDHYLPVNSDDVLGLLFDEQAYSFPDNWRRPYLRSGNDNRLIPFDPTENYDLEEEAQAELAMLEQLEAYKTQWLMNADQLSAEEKERLTREYFQKLDQILKKPEE